MDGKINHMISEMLRQDDLNQLTGYIEDVCELLVEDFTRKGRNLPNDENQIRSIMVEEYLDNDEVRKTHDMLEYSFTSEAQEHYDGNGNYIGRVDIRIKLKTDFDKHNAYYIAECKRIDGSANLNKKYVEKGIMRFVTSKYSAYYGKNIMLGFIVKSVNIFENVKEIENIQNSSADVHPHGNFDMLNRGKGHEEYKCEYQIESGELELRHVFLDFSDLMIQ